MLFKAGAELPKALQVLRFESGVLLDEGVNGIVKFQAVMVHDDRDDVEVRIAVRSFAIVRYYILNSHVNLVFTSSTFAC